MNGPVKPCTVIFLYQNPGNLEDRPELVSFRRYLGPLLSSCSFQGKFLESTTLFLPKEDAWIVCVGLGKEEQITEARLIDIGAEAVSNLTRLGIREAYVALPPVDVFGWSKVLELLAIGAKLAIEKTTNYKTSPESKEPYKTKFLTFQYLGSRDPLEKPQVILSRAELIATAQLEARVLTDMPPNLLYPASFAAEAKRVALKHKLKITVWEEEKLVKEGMGGVVAVGISSVNRPALVIIEYPGRQGSKDLTALVGKGITFDTGGLQIKSSESMINMKSDMSGAATVLAVINACAEFRLSQKVIGIIPLAENHVGSRAYRPGDVIKTFSGQTVEVTNTDAEGRLILADALSLAQKYKPNVIIDIATLTGACSVALGEKIAGIFSDDPYLQNALLDTGISVGENFWPLPLFKDYEENLESPLADIKQTVIRAGAAIYAALFLKQFVKPPVAWAHLDIAGTARSSHKTPSCPEGVTAFGTRTLLKYLINNSVT
jgi:leucyl aminopeptidase